MGTYVCQYVRTAYGRSICGFPLFLRMLEPSSSIQALATQAFFETKSGVYPFHGLLAHQQTHFNMYCWIAHVLLLRVILVRLGMLCV